ncbi:hypothetical protein ACROYT_G016445 [Oculina patagonica]
MMKTYLLIAFAAFLLLTTLVAESESFGNMVPPGKRQLAKKIAKYARSPSKGFEGLYKDRLSLYDDGEQERMTNRKEM